MKAIRESDIAARFGGEEILIIAPNTNIRFAAALAERLRHYVETQELKLTHMSGETLDICIAVSIGVAGLGQKATDYQRLIHKADEVQYRAKQEGCNRIVVHDGNVQNVMFPMA